jgi:hypothetical protein
MRRLKSAMLPVVSVALLVGGCGRAGDEKPAPRDAEEAPVTLAQSCVETYNSENLSGRSFAFDGTVLSIELRRDPRLPAGEDRVPWATFKVNRWFRGGAAPEIGVWIENLNAETSAGTIEAEAGTRLLVAGEPRWGGGPLEDPFAWACGFTQPWTAEAAAEWEAAFQPK